MDSSHTAHDSGVETGSTSMNSVKNQSGSIISGLDSTDTNYAEDISSDEEEKVTYQHSDAPSGNIWTNLNSNTDTPRAPQDLFKDYSEGHFYNSTSLHSHTSNEDLLDFEDNYASKYTNKCDEYSGRASSSRSATSGKSTPKHKPMELVVSRSSQTLVLKTPSHATSDERDVFSPEEDLSFIRHEESAAMTPDDVMLDEAILLLDDQNKKFDQSLHSIISKSSTKEEKQRQNEEIVNLESSSISSETGSWESVFPARSNLEAREMCTSFLLNEKEFCSLNTLPNTSRKPVSEITNVITMNTKYSLSLNSTPVKRNACFIDASTLSDDADVYSNKPISWQTCENNASSSSSKPTISKISERVLSNPININKSDNFENELDLSETLETKINQKKIKRSDSNSSMSEEYSESNDVEFFGQKDLNFHVQFAKCKKSKNTNKSRPKNNNEHLQSLDMSDASSSSKELQNDIELSSQTRGKSLDLDNIQNSLTYEDTGIDIQSTGSDTNTHIDSELSSAQKEVNAAFILQDDAQISDIEGNMEQTHEDYLNETIVLPDTPHNSIIEIDKGTVEDTNLVIYNKSMVDSPFKSQKYSEGSPIISGGACAEDFVPKIHGSPMVRRKIDSIPIVSGGGYIALPDENVVVKKRELMPTAAWVVDMSDCSSSSSLDSKINRNDSSTRETSSSRKSSLGFFVDFSDTVNKSKTPTNSSPSSSSTEDKVKSSDGHNSDTKKSLGFFVDFSNDAGSDQEKTKTDEQPAADKKNIFSMFIDFGEKTIKGIPDRLSSSLHVKPLSRLKSATSGTDRNGKMNTATMAKSLATNGTDRNAKMNTATMAKSLAESGTPNGSVSSTPKELAVAEIDQKKRKTSTIVIKENEMMNETNKHNEDPDFTMTTEQPPIHMRTNDMKTGKPTIKRHSWNMENSERTAPVRHKRAMSVSDDKDSVDIDSQQLQQRKNTVGSTFSVDSCLSELSGKSGCSGSTTSSGYARMSDLKQRKHRRDCAIDETFDKSSPGSQTEGILTDASPNTDDDVTYQNDEETLEEPAKSPERDTDQARSGSTRSSPVKSTQNDINSTVYNGKPATIGYTLNIDDAATEKTRRSPEKSPEAKNSVAHTMETLQAKIERQKQLLATVTEASESQDQQRIMTDSGKFVRLSDLDKPIPKLDLLNEKVMSNSTGSNRIYKLFASNLDGTNRNFMSRSIGNNATANLITSVENSRSLSRLFPHLSKGFSSSVPNGVGGANIYGNRSPLDTDDFTSDLSATSSLSSSLGKSILDSTEDSLSKQPRRLGEDLLRMFLEEIAPDVTLDVGGRRMRAHKCILRSRCQYFAAILAGGWVESAGNVITMEGFSYGAVHFALCHIYSGATTPPEGISLQELASLADLLGLEGLKEVTAHALKATYCHMFHKPCHECISGVCQVLPLALTYGLDELYRRAMRWVCRYFLKVWPTRPFALLTSDIMDRARHQIIAHLNIENVLGTILDCEQLLATLPNSRWACTVEVLAMSLLENAHIYVADHYSSLLASNSFLSLGRDMCWNISRLQTTLSEAASNLTPDQACRSYQRITRLCVVVHRRKSAGLIKDENLRQDEIEWHPDFTRLVDHLSGLVETCLVKQGARAMRVAAWGRLEPHLRRRIQDMACLGCTVERKSRSVRSASSSRSQDLKQIRQVIHAHSTRALSQENQSKYLTLPLHRILDNTVGSAQRTASCERHPTTTSNKNAQDNKTIAPVQHNTTKNTSHSITKNSSDKNILADKLETKEMMNRRQKLMKATNPAHQRSLSEKKSRDSEVPLKPKSLSARVAHAKPRYLEPRKRDLETNTVTAKKGTNVKNKLLSSSESSRTPSPAQKSQAGRTRRGESSNMSLDSLASHKIKSLQKNDACMEMSTDSLVGSMHTSTQTIDTIENDRSIAEKENRSNDKMGTFKSKSSPNIKKRTNLTLPQNHVKPKVISKSGTSSTTVRSPSTAVKNKIISSNSISQRNSAISSNNSPSLRRNLLTPGKKPMSDSTIKKSPSVNKFSVKQQSISRTLTSPTKSSAAKMVTSVRKKSNEPVLVTGKQKNNRDKSQKQPKVDGVELEGKIIAHMERSGTFLKDEPSPLLVKTLEAE